MRLQYTRVEITVSNGHFNSGVLESHDVWASKRSPNDSLQSHYIFISKQSSFMQRYNFDPLVQDGS